MSVVNLWRVYLVRGVGDMLYIGAVRAVTEIEALAAAREKFVADDPLPWQVRPQATLAVARA